MPAKPLLNEEQLATVTEWLHLVAQIEVLTQRRDELSASIGIRPEALMPDTKKKRSRPLKTVAVAKVAANSCEVCGKEFPSIRSLNAHVSRVHKGRSARRRIPCAFCGELYRPGPGMSSHMRASHPEPEEAEKSFSCEFCDRKFKSKPGMLAHVRTQHAGAAK